LKQRLSNLTAPFTPSRLRRTIWLVAALIGSLLACAALYALKHRPPRPPSIATGGLDPAVAKLIEGALRGVRDAPRSGDAWGRLGSALMHYEFIPEAEGCFDQAEKFSPANPRWPYLHALLVLSRHPADAAPLLRRAVAACGERPDMPRVQLAQWLAERGETAEAEQHFQSLLRLATNHPPALLGLARLRRAQARLEDCRGLLDRCLGDPHTAKAAHALLAQIQQALGDTPAAEAAARRAASLPPDGPWPDPFWAEASAFRVGRKALLQDASALLDQEQLGPALQILATVTRDYPADDEAWYLTGWALNRAQRSAEAEHVLREHLRRSPNSPKGHAQLAVSLLNQKRPAEAVDVLEAALKLKPTWRELHFNLGYACAQLSRDADAIRHLRDALALDPNHVPTYTALAELLLRRGNATDARRLLLQALDFQPTDARASALLQSLPPGE
jgi:tetratricopeptide (TPR) repeat protein